MPSDNVMGLCILILIPGSCSHRDKNSQQRNKHTAQVKEAFKRDRENYTHAFSVDQPPQIYIHHEWAREFPMVGERGGQRRTHTYGPEAKSSLFYEIGSDALIKYTNWVEFRLHKALWGVHSTSTWSLTSTWPSWCLLLPGPGWDRYIMGKWAHGWPGKQVELQ